MSENKQKKKKKDKDKDKDKDKQEGNQAKRQEKRRKRQLKEQQQRQRQQRQMQAQVDSLVTPIYSSGLADGYKYFLQQLYKEGVRFNIFQYAAQKILKYEKIQKEKAKKIQQLNKN